MSGISKLSAGPSLASFRSIGSDFKPPELGAVPGQQTADNALKALSQNPLLRSLLGESSFDAATGTTKADKANASAKARPEEALKQILDTLKQLVSVLKSLAGQKPGEDSGAGAGQQPQGAASAGSPQSPAQPQTQQAGAPQNPAQSAAPQGAAPTEGAEGAQAPAAEEETDPLQKLIKALEQIVSQIGELLKSLGGQGTPGAADTSCPSGVCGTTPTQQPAEA
ncbi:hypothetical protein [Pyxidicoccus xibeiensis]|uniref:hypothetical protein n=1 Tax=Pyxidicoccus xibeiensis TaxID=2906759 RepID=UPI0020A6F6AF|nr:hypothetical protein [Pyxidicoccus xibeiensis]MCP3139305.1 hypothetical protein [Pyxidicoccus xibeiensis]